MTAASKSPTAKQIWDKLSKGNVNEHTEKKGHLTYLSWSWAWTYMMDHYPDLTVKGHGTTDENGVTRDITTYPGGTASVCCSVTIGEVKREMWLPVMDYKNKSIANPDSMAINTAKMRCLTKCFGILGLGCYIYAGEDLPTDSVADTIVEAPPKKKAAKKKAPDKKPEAKPEPKENNLSEENIDEAIIELKAVVNALFNRGWEPEDPAFKKSVGDAINGRDGEPVMRLTREIKDVGEQALKLHNAGEDENNA